MLNKELCKKCWNRNTTVGADWTAIDDYNWQEGTVFCKHETNNEFHTISIEGEPPYICDYRLEHIISA
jgi:hypothetical protein